MKEVFILLTNKHSDPIIDLYKKLQSSISEEDNLYIMYHASRNIIPEAVRQINYHSFTDSILNELNYIPMQQTLVPGNNHFPLLQFYLANRNYDYYWYIEDDVRYNGNWNNLFGFFKERPSQPDFLSTHIRTYQEQPSWFWWNSIQHNTKFIPFYLRIKSFNPIIRISNEALNFLHHCLYTCKWQGHHEALLPTLLFLEGFKIEDFGGQGSFVYTEMKNRFYIDSDSNEIGMNGTSTFRYRPAIESMTVKNKLYHPVKV